jgi:hypothetical protein
MASAKRKLVVIPRDTTNKRRRVATLKHTEYAAAAPIEVISPAYNRYNQGLYPWDDYQDDIVVNSIEGDLDQYLSRSLLGAEHYKNEISRRKDYRHPCVHFDEYRVIGQRAENPLDTEDSNDSDADVKPVPHELVEKAYLPTPNEHYNENIYKASTTNPAIFLAMARIAQKNIRFLNFTSALNHLPNLSPDARLPRLIKGEFTADIAHTAKDMDIKFTVTFLPKYYGDEHHAVGFFTLERDPNPASTRVWARTCLFTPCSIKDLEEYGLVEWGLNGKRGGKIAAVGSRDGAWLDSDVVEDWEEWRTCEMIVGNVWGKRVKTCRGV